MRPTWNALFNKIKRGNSVESSRFFVWQSTMSEDEKVVLKDKLDFNAGLVFFEGHPFSGVCVDYFTGAGGTTYTDEKKMETYYKNGEKDGLLITWDRTGKVLSKFMYKEGKTIDGYLITSWHENKQKKKETHYKDGIQDGIWIEWYPNGKKKLENHYKDGYDNVWNEWDENGKIMFQNKFFKNKFGKITTTEWHPNGKLQLEEHYYQEGRGKERGIYTEWDENGKITFQRQFKNGIGKSLSTERYSSGQKKLEKEYKYKNGVDDGIWTEWHINGKKKLEKHYKDGVEDGLWTEWGEDGKITFQGRFKDGNEKRGFFG